MHTKNSILLDSTVSQNKGVIVSDMDGEKVMLSVQNGKYYNLGDIGGQIWDLIENPINVKQLITKLLTVYDVPQTDCQRQVTSFLDHLLAENLIQIQN